MKVTTFFLIIAIALLVLSTLTLYWGMTTEAVVIACTVVNVGVGNLVVKCIIVASKKQTS